MSKEDQLGSSVQEAITSIVNYKRLHTTGLGLTYNELAVLKAVQTEDKGQGVSVKNISEKAQIPNSTASAAGGRLFRDEYLDKFFDRKHPGEVLYRLTEIGRCCLVTDSNDSKQRRNHYVRVTKMLAQKRGEQVWDIVTEWLDMLRETMEEASEKEKEGLKKIKKAIEEAVEADDKK